MSHCPICLDNKSSIFSTIPCNHSFCEKCIFDWLENSQTCPLCRQTVDKMIMTKCRDSYYGSDTSLFALATIIGAT